ncbi:unnamed protein product, partial [Mesorhabditis belari]|uniref:Uncharacterized protein n=1 Tax=Mesorhabditis belari TaxID=2138241 RepID=A0AAF3EFS1_9BILA
MEAGCHTYNIDIEAEDSEEKNEGEPETRKKTVASFKCQLCFAQRSLDGLRRLPLRKEKYEPILWGANAAYEIVMDIMRRLELRRGIRICREHYPTEAEANVIPKAERIYPIQCKLCGRKRPPMMLRNVPACLEKRSLFYDYAQVPPKKREEFDRHFLEKPRVNLLVCVNHFPFPKREVKATLRSAIGFTENRQLRRILKDGASTSNANENKKKTKSSSLVRCHWCNESHKPKDLRKFPDYPPAQQEFFELNRVSEDRRSEILNLQQERMYGLKMCYSHFPKAWARARGRFWYRLYFGEKSQKAVKVDAKEINISVTNCEELPSTSSAHNELLRQRYPIEDEESDVLQEEDEEIDVEGEGCDECPHSRTCRWFWALVLYTRVSRADNFCCGCSPNIVPTSLVFSSNCDYKDLTEERQISASRGGLKQWHSSALPYRLRHIFTDIVLDLKSDNLAGLKVYLGENCTAVQKAYNEDNAYFGYFSAPQWFRSNRFLPIFNDTFIGIDADNSYEISRHVELFNSYRWIPFVVALFFFYFAPTLVRQAGFYYAGGVSTGLVASVLIIAIIVYRLAPKKVIGIPIILGGWTATGYMLQFAYGNFTWLMDAYRSYVIGYFAIWVIGTLAYCYRSGPPTDIRSFNMLQWGLQATACLAIYFSIQLVEVSFALITLLILGSFFPKVKNIVFLPFTILNWFLGFIGLNYDRVPRRHFLTEEEYVQQTKETTEKELRKLRDYCKSPNADWRRISQHVSNPKKLARFADGLDEHVTSSERRQHSLEPEYSEDDNDVLFSDDDSTETRSLAGKDARSSSSRSIHTPSEGNISLRNRILRRNATTSSRAPLKDADHSIRNAVRRSLPVHHLGHEELKEAEISLLRELESVRRQKLLNSSRVSQQAKTNDPYLDEDEDMEDEDNESFL